MPSPWVWVPSAHTYRNTATGRFMGAEAMVGLRDRFTDYMIGQARDLAERLASGALSPEAWHTAMQQQIKTVTIDQYVMARGGRNAMTHADWGRVGQMTRQQYTYLARFANDVAEGRYTDADGNLKPGAIGARAEMYMESGTTAYERGRVQAYGMPDLPAYPGGPGCRGLTRCRCHWRIEEVEDGWDCYWEAMGDAGTCDVCDERAKTWYPLHVRSNFL